MALLKGLSSSLKHRTTHYCVFSVNLDFSHLDLIGCEVTTCGQAKGLPEVGWCAFSCYPSHVDLSSKLEGAIGETAWASMIPKVIFHLWLPLGCPVTAAQGPGEIPLEQLS